MLLSAPLRDGSTTLLYLASQSPRRRQLLEQLGVRFDTIDVDVPEVRAPGESPADYVSRVAREKAGAGLLKLAGVPGAVVLGADTEVVLGDEVFGKPADAVHAAQMLRRLEGRAHQVITVVWCMSAGREERAFNESTVEFGALSEADNRGVRRERRADGPGRCLRDPGQGGCVHRADLRQLFERHGAAAVRDGGLAAALRHCARLNRLKPRGRVKSACSGRRPRLASNRRGIHARPQAWLPPLAFATGAGYKSSYEN